MAGGVKWYGDEFKGELAKGLRRNISAASIYLASQVKADISQDGTVRYAVAPKKPRKKPAKNPRQKTIYNVTHSAPGNPPYKQTGHLRRSIGWELTGAGMRPIGRVGTYVVYGRYLELGTKRGLKARPYLRRNLRKHATALEAILTRRIQPGGLAAIVSNQRRSGVLGAGARQVGLR